MGFNCLDWAMLGPHFCFVSVLSLKPTQNILVGEKGENKGTEVPGA